MSVRAWIEAARRGDGEARNRLAELYMPKLVLYCAGKMSSDLKRWVAPEDLASIVITERLAKLDQLPEDAAEDDFERYLKRTATSRILDHALKHGGDQGESILGRDADLDDDGPPRPRARAAPQPTTGPVTRADDLRWLRERMASLPEHYRAVAQLVAFDRLTYEEAATELGLETDTVRRRYGRLRKALERRGRSM